jgi:hypothetical protein
MAMAISRPLLLALLGAVLLAATWFAVQNARDESGGETAPALQQAQPDEQAAAPAQPAEPVQPGEPAKLTAEEALRSITSPGTQVRSGRFELDFEYREIGGGREHDLTQLTGAFECGCKADVPKFDISVKSHDESGYGDKGDDTSYRMVSTGEKGLVGDDETLYEVNQGAFKGIATIRAGVAAGALANQPDFDVARWATNPRIVGTETVDGVEATHVRADVSARRVASDVVKLLRADSSSTAVDVPQGAVRTVERAIANARVDAWVGSDRVVRRVELRVRAGDIPRPLREANDAPRGSFRLSFSMSDVNEPGVVDSPGQVSSEPAAEGMGAKTARAAQTNLTLGALLVSSPTSFAGTTVVVARLVNAGRQGEGAKKAARAVADGKKVVILFQTPGGLDDRAMRATMRELAARTRAVVITDHVDAVDRYGTMVQDLGVSQTPSVVLIDRRGQGRLVEGFVDTNTLIQAVADAR